MEKKSKRICKGNGDKIHCVTKKRDRKTGKVEIKQTSDVVRRDLILVDDMISTGGSIVNATKFLKKEKCNRVFVACTHALLMNDAERKKKIWSYKNRKYKYYYRENIYS